ncbi:Fcf1-domain-containing protein [Russula brevipes]|nr:Fcf1-domain-containing protein [Russula brevipes]
MRQNRSKAYRKLMAMYSTSFGFRQPYQVLVDSELCEVAASQKMDLLTRVESVLVVGSVKMMITQCCIHELYLKGKSHQPAVDLAKSFERRKCNHKEAVPGDECIIAVVDQKHRYVVATQSHPLRVGLRAVPGVPIVHMNRSVMVLEPASDATLQSKRRGEQDALGPSTSEKAMLSAVTPRVEPTGPNPLSVKKKAPKHNAQEVKKAIVIAATATTEHVEVRSKRKRQAADDGDPPRETERKPKRRRRHKSTTRVVDESN